MGGLNAKVDKERDDEIVCKFRLGTRNEPREKCTQWCTVSNESVRNFWFEEHLRSLWKWQTEEKKRKKQIAYTVCS